MIVVMILVVVLQNAHLLVLFHLALHTILHAGMAEVLPSSKNVGKAMKLMNLQQHGFANSYLYFFLQKSRLKTTGFSQAITCLVTAFALPAPKPAQNHQVS